MSLHDCSGRPNNIIDNVHTGKDRNTHNTYDNDSNNNMLSLSLLLLLVVVVVLVLVTLS